MLVSLLLPLALSICPVASIALTASALYGALTLLYTSVALIPGLVNSPLLIRSNVLVLLRKC